MADTTAVAVPNLSREDLVSRLRALRPLFEREGVTRMTLFGSRARGDNRPDSDVDLVIDVDPKHVFSLVEMARISHAVETQIGFPASIVLRRSARPSMLSAATRDGVTVF